MASFWTKLRVKLNPRAKSVGQYTKYTMDEEEFVAAVTWDLDQLRSRLRDWGYEPQKLSAAKTHHTTGQPHDLSYRRVPEEHPELAEDRRVGQEYEPNECQYHVHAFVMDSEIEVYSHYEARPDFLWPRPSLERLDTHYRPDYGEDYLKGVTDLDI